MILYPNNPKSHHLLKPARVVFLVLGIMLLLGACTTPEPPDSQVVIITPTDTHTPPPSPIPTMIPSPTPYPEGAIALPLYESDPERIEIIETWAQELSQATGLNLILVPGIKTETGLLEALRDGKIHMAEINPLVYLVGSEQGWVEPGPIRTYDGQEAEAIMFISRTDTGFLPGEPPEVFQQLEGWRACWPDTQPLNPGLARYFALPSYILPLGLLRLNEVDNIEPVMRIGLSSQGYTPVLDQPVFDEECEFAAIPALSPEDFLNRGPTPIGERDEWEEKMQVLYTTAPINPFGLYVFSSTLPEAVREQLSLAILANPSPYDSEFIPFNETLYDEFRRIVLASEVDIQSYLFAPDS